LNSDKLLNYIYSENIHQKKRLQPFFSSNSNVKKDLELFLEMYNPYMKSENISIEQLADAYLLMLRQVLHARLSFVRTGKYQVKSFDEAYDMVYNDANVMKQYMLGLALSQFLWEHHYKVFNFFSQQLTSISNNANVLEIGSGHGLFLVELLEKVSLLKNCDVVDISETSLEMTKNIYKTLNLDKKHNVNFVLNDVNDYKSQYLYDFIVMGEVLEHVEHPGKILDKLYTLLEDNGEVYISTCSNCPAIDHITYFKDIEDIRLLVEESEFIIKEECIAPSESMSMDKLQKYKVDIVYAAILKKGKK
jgi:2-polyprenyl-3-methyl-5-hydroxy-6-metoxy-1,4-benzoquinol methylase